MTRLPDLVIPVNQLSSNSISLIRILFGCYPEKTLPYFFQGGKSTHIFKTKNAAAACAKTPHHWRSSLYMYLLCKKAGKIVKISDERKCHIAFDHMKLTIFYLYKLDKSDKEKGVKTYWNWKIFLSHICYLFVVVYFVCRLKFKAWKHPLYATLFADILERGINCTRNEMFLPSCKIEGKRVKISDERKFHCFWSFIYSTRKKGVKT